MKEDVIEDTFLEGLSRQMCLKSNINERIQHFGFLRTTENPNYVFFFQYLSTNTFFFLNWGGGGKLCKISVSY